MINQIALILTATFKHTANILVAKIATISCVRCPVAIWLQFLQLSIAQLQLPIIAIFAPNSCKLHEQDLDLLTTYPSHIDYDR